MKMWKFPSTQDGGQASPSLGVFSNSGKDRWSLLHLDVFPLQGPELHLDVSTLQSPVLHLDEYPLQVPDLYQYLGVSTLLSPALHLDVSRVNCVFSSILRLQKNSVRFVLILRSFGIIQFIFLASIFLFSGIIICYASNVCRQVRAQHRPL